MSLAARVVAQAKVNLVLRVLARETSGYHAIETLFARLDLGDDVLVRITRGRSLDCTGPALPASGLGPAEGNLAYRAAAAYAQATGWPQGFAIEITKRIPVGGGLGGGSADAGAVLRALDALSPRPLAGRLVELAAALGADVPFMTLDSPVALGWGRGERLLPLPAPESRPVLLAIPDFSIATGEAYGWLAAGRGAYQPAAGVLSMEDLTCWEGIERLVSNDFERPVSARHPEIAQIADALRRAGAHIAMVSGSGSAVFGVFDGAVSPGQWPPDAIAGAARIMATRTSVAVEQVQVESANAV